MWAVMLWFGVFFPPFYPKILEPLWQRKALDCGASAALGCKRLLVSGWHEAFSSVCLRFGDVGDSSSSLHFFFFFLLLPLSLRRHMAKP